MLWRECEVCAGPLGTNGFRFTHTRTKTHTELALAGTGASKDRKVATSHLHTEPFVHTKSTHNLHSQAQKEQKVEAKEEQKGTRKHSYTRMCS
jgi:hypothetical protein